MGDGKRNGDAACVLYVDVERSSLVEQAKLAGIRRCAATYGWKVAVLEECQSRPQSLAKALAAKKPVGCIVECAAGHGDLPPAVFGDLPVVYLDAEGSLYGRNAPKVVHDGAAMAHLAFGELSDGRPSAYAAVGYCRPAYWSPLRLRAFERRSSERGKRCRTFMHVGQDREPKLREWLAALPPRSAIFAVDDEVAHEVSKLCREIGRRIPTDLTLVGVDNCDRFCLRSSPQLSSVQIDFELAGFNACELLHRLCLGDRTRLRVTFGPLMIVRRESTSGFGRRERRIDDVVELIRREACNGLDVRDVLKSMRGSRRLSELRFREALGHSIHDEIVMVRFARVFQLLREPSVTIERVIEASGFRTGATLRKAFLLRTGLSLSAWRKQNLAMR